MQLLKSADFNMLRLKLQCQNLSSGKLVHSNILQN